jgi:hypothetical protein
LRLSGIYNNQNLIVMQTSTKVNYSPKSQKASKMSQKQLDAIAELKKYYPDLPQDLIINGNLNLADKLITILPDGLTINGSLDVRGCCYLEAYPKNLTIKGNFYTDWNLDLEIPSCLIVHGQLSEIDTSILPDNFTVGGDLVVESSSDKLPNNLTVGGSLDLTGTDITELPSGLKVLGNLNAHKLPLKSLPDDLYVGGSLKLSETPIKTIPSTVFIGGGLDIRETDIKLFPKQLKEVKGDLVINRVRIKYLPDNLIIHGNFYANSSGLQELPNNLQIAGSLSIEHTAIEELPDDLRVGKGYDLGGSGISILPAGLQINGELDITDSLVADLPSDLIVNESLRINHSLVKKLPKFLNVGTLYVSASKAPSDIFPDGFSITGDLNINDYGQEKEKKAAFILPDNMKIGGSLDMDLSGQNKLPNNLYVGGDLDIERLDNLKRLPKDIKVMGKLKLGRHYDIIQDFLSGKISIDGTVQMSYDNYRMGSAGVMYKKDEIYNRLTREGDVVFLAPALKEAPANQDGGTLDAAPVKSKALTEA